MLLLQCKERKKVCLEKARRLVIGDLWLVVPGVLYKNEQKLIPSGFRPSELHSCSGLKLL